MDTAEALGLQSTELLAHGSGGGGSTTKVQASQALKRKTVALYFSAHWCPPCKAFTPILAQVYRTVRWTHEDFEVLFVSADRDEHQFQQYFEQMPWLAVPFDDHALRQWLNSKYGVMGIPRLVIVGPDGEVIANDARMAVMNDQQGEQYPWHGAAGGPSGLAGLLASPRGLLLVFLFLYWISQWFSSSK